MAKKEKKESALLMCWARSPWKTRCIRPRNHKDIYHGDMQARLWT